MYIHMGDWGQMKVSCLYIEVFLIQECTFIEVPLYIHNILIQLKEG